jgi:glycosyl transferase family 25
MTSRNQALLLPKLDAVYVVNVKKLTDRRLFMEKQLARFKMQAEFILDYDVEDLNDSIIAQYFMADSLSMPQMSCAMKHICALQKIAETNSPFSLVLEDDAVFSKHFNLGINYALTESSNFVDNKVVYIGSAGNYFTPKSKKKKGQHLYAASRGRFTDSYIIDSETAKMRLQWIYKNKISKPVDDQFDYIDAELGIAMLWLEDPVVEQGSKNGLFNSEIMETASNLQCLQGIRFFLQKIRRKYIYQLFS